MWLKRIEFENFRNLKPAGLDLEQGLNWFVGENGQGKTNALEAPYFILTGKSFRTHRMADLIGTGAASFRLQSILQKGNSQIPIRLQYLDGKNQRFIGSKACKASDVYRMSAVFAFTARSKNFIEGSPDERRKFLDRIISYLNFDHMVALSRYRKVHSQLRSILHQSRDLHLYKSFKNSAIPIARQIVSNRVNFLESIHEDAQQLFGSLFFEQTPLKLKYKLKNCPDPDNYANRMLDISAREILTGRSLMGPQLDDVGIEFSSLKASSYASSGQIRAMILSILLAAREAYRRSFGFYPIMILDDIDAELDFKRLEKLLNYLEKRGQSLISTSKYDRIDRFPQSGNFYRLDDGSIDLERKV